MFFLHIGQGKAGSTTIQHFLASSKEKLEARGFAVPDLPMQDCAQLIGEKSAKKSSDPNALADIRSFAAAETGRKIVVSSEYLSTLTQPAQVEQFRALLGSHRARVIVYVRDYPSLAVSLYNQATKKGKNTANFDRYLARKSTGISFVPSVLAWAEVFGWENIRVRSLDRSSLQGESLLQDFCSACGLPLSREEVMSVSSQNVSEGWIAIELRRAMAASLPSKDKAIADAYRRASLVLSRLIEKNLGEEELARKTQYLTPNQWRRLSTEYNRDLEIINSKTDAPIPKLIASAPGERPFLPTAEAIPAGTRQRLAKLVATIRKKQGDSDAIRLLSELLLGSKEKAAELSNWAG